MEKLPADRAGGFRKSTSPSEKNLPAPVSPAVFENLPARTKKSTGSVGPAIFENLPAPAKIINRPWLDQGGPGAIFPGFFKWPPGF